MLFDVIQASPVYSQMSVAEIYHSIVAADHHGKMLKWTQPNGVWVGFMTFAMLPHDKVHPFLAGDYKVQDNDFANDKGELWVMDFVAPFGKVPTMMMEAQHYFAERYGDGMLIQWKRSKRNPPKTGWCYARKQFDVAA